MEKSELQLSYTAQTRGFKYAIEIRNDSVFKDINSIHREFLLKDTQLKELNNLLNEINFEDLRNNIDPDELLVDASVKGVFNLIYHKDKYEFEFDHNNLPDQIEVLLKKIERYE